MRKETDQNRSFLPFYQGGRKESTKGWKTVICPHLMPNKSGWSTDFKGGERLLQNFPDKIPPLHESETDDYRIVRVFK